MAVLFFAQESCELSIPLKCGICTLMNSKTSNIKNSRLARRAQGRNAAWGAGLAAWDLVARDAAVRSAANIWLNHDHLGLGYELVSQPILEVSEQNTSASAIASEPLDRYKRLLLGEVYWRKQVLTKLRGCCSHGMSDSGEIPDIQVDHRK